MPDIQSIPLISVLEIEVEKKEKVTGSSPVNGSEIIP